MMVHSFSGGVWPVMLTPFTDDDKVDYHALGNLVDWYIKKGVSGLFAVCQSSEMFFLSLEERVEISRFVQERANGRVPVISSGHISDSFADQVKELNLIAKTGVDALIFITNRLAKEDESDAVWLDNLKALIRELPENIALGLYECPYPYKRIVSPENLHYCAQTGRFFFLKDTSCDVENIRAKLDAIRGTQLRLYNANSATLYETLKIGAGGYSGVMANFHPELYVWLLKNWQKNPEKAERLSNFISLASLIERQVYPVNAKYNLNLQGVKMSLHCRTRDASVFNATNRLEIEQLKAISEEYDERFLAE